MKPPLILVGPSTQKHGVEFSDNSISLSNQYSLAVATAGGLPSICPCISSESFIKEAVERSDGVMLTGGDDIQPELYSPKVPDKLRGTVSETDRARDLFELMLIEEVFRQGKPLLAICRGLQILNAAFGGSLYVDLPLQKGNTINHKRMDRKSEVVHSVALTRGSLLARISRKSRFGVNSSHHQAVSRVAKPFQITARSADGVIEAMELKPNATHPLPFMVAVQYHPERLFDRYPEHLALFQQFVRAAALGRGSI
jgi:putative glutamine amidotransferase